MLSADAQRRTVAVASANRLSLSEARLTTWHSLMTQLLTNEGAVPETALACA